VSKLHLSNKLSALETQCLASNAAGAGATGVTDIASVGASGLHPGNAHRDLMRRYLKGCSVPEVYVAEIPIHDPQSDTDHVPVMLPFLLPHEMIHCILKGSARTADDLAQLPEGGPLDNVATVFAHDKGVERNRVLPIGFHGDGVPHKKNKSVQVFSWNFLSKGHSERFLFTAIDKEYCCQCGCGGRCTLDPIVAVFAWSMKMSALGKWPRRRHDGEPWLHSDRHRRSIRGNFFVRPVLLQARGDWSWYKELFGFPSWASSAICWKCRATKRGKRTFTNHSQDAPWRRKRMTSIEFFQQQTDANVRPSPLFLCPYFELWMVIIDALHCMDLGVSQDCLGNLFYEAQKSLCDGRNIKVRVKNLWGRVKEYYKVAKPASQIQTLTVPMIKQQKKSPKLHLKGAETRGLIAFGAELASALDKKEKTTHSGTVHGLFCSLLDMYMHMANDDWDQDGAATCCRQFCLLYSALSSEAVRNHGAETLLWREKPKVHMLEELFEFQGREMDMSPADFWCYKDEDFVGWVASFAGSRGGPSRCVTSTFRTLQRYRAWIHAL